MLGPRPSSTSPCRTRPHTRSRTAPALVRVALALAAAGGAACSADLPYADTGSAYSGPSLELDSNGPRHIVVISAPSAGWRAAVDRVTERHRFTDAFVTLSPPDGRFLVSETPTRQHLALPIESRHPVRVCVRVAPADAEAHGPYPVVAQSTPAAPR